MTAIRRRTSIGTIAGLILALGWPYAGMILRGGRVEYISDVRSDLRVLITEWAVTILLAGIVLYWERRSPSSVGWRMPSWRDIGAMLLALVAMYLAAAIASTALFFAAHAHAETLRTTLRGAAGLPFAVKLAIPITAGVCEEFLFRGYALERLREISGSPLFASLVTIGLFTLAHIPRYGFGPGLLIVAIIATALTALYLWRRNLPANMLMHAIIDGIGVMTAR